MPGLLTAAQLRELDAAHGAEFDRLFLTYMIQHHQGASPPQPMASARTPKR